MNIIYKFKNKLIKISCVNIKIRVFETFNIFCTNFEKQVCLWLRLLSKQIRRVYIVNLIMGPTGQNAFEKIHI